jgi:hypothetical protein
MPSWRVPWTVSFYAGLLSYTKQKKYPMFTCIFVSGCVLQHLLSYRDSVRTTRRILRTHFETSQEAYAKR